ncbi:ABC transporter ATP-binding protein [Halorubellus sp. JP-L1]|uniref:ABC transporter ATP-binding protein n=1 Tax=Halorubellus sp. JP-L1 TaxID=2715753 RepID=UPI00140DC02D|nr:ABC transporter ATP-binding protein [Halorubellus sp. JP-L1]NHN43036.1 ABC transporter ATP-binding protein [Halorubellus sp. JP-L1]
MAAIEIEGLRKRFGADAVAVDGIDLTVAEGEVFGFLGPNGAGKSTTINMMLDFVRPTEGRVEVFGTDVQADPLAVRERVGVLPEGYGFDDPLLGREYLEWAIGTKDASDDPDELLDLVGLAEDADRYATDYSKGMQQRLAFAMALVDDPDLLVLDEPSTGLDPNGMQQMRDVVRERAANGTTVFFSSHILSEVQSVCDRVGVMNDGRLVAVDTIEGLQEGLGGHANITLECGDRPDENALERVDGVVDVAVEGTTVDVACAHPGAKAEVVTHLAGRTSVDDIRSEGASLQSLFSELTDGGRDGESEASEESDAGDDPATTQAEVSR